MQPVRFQGFIFSLRCPGQFVVNAWVCRANDCRRMTEYEGRVAIAEMTLPTLTTLQQNMTNMQTKVNNNEANVNRLSAAVDGLLGGKGVPSTAAPSASSAGTTGSDAGLVSRVDALEGRVRRLESSGIVAGSSVAASAPAQVSAPAQTKAVASSPPRAAMTASSSSVQQQQQQQSPITSKFQSDVGSSSRSRVAESHSVMQQSMGSVSSVSDSSLDHDQEPDSTFFTTGSSTLTAANATKQPQAQAQPRELPKSGSNRNMFSDSEDEGDDHSVLSIPSLPQSPIPKDKESAVKAKLNESTGTESLLDKHSISDIDIESSFEDSGMDIQLHKQGVAASAIANSSSTISSDDASVNSSEDDNAGREDEHEDEDEHDHGHEEEQEPEAYNPQPVVSAAMATSKEPASSAAPTTGTSQENHGKNLDDSWVSDPYNDRAVSDDSSDDEDSDEGSHHQHHRHHGHAKGGDAGSKPISAATLAARTQYLDDEDDDDDAPRYSPTRPGRKPAAAVPETKPAAASDEQDDVEEFNLSSESE
jgi:hypothetical protein